MKASQLLTHLVAGLLGIAIGYFLLPGKDEIRPVPQTSLESRKEGQPDTAVAVQTDDQVAPEKSPAAEGEPLAQNARPAAAPVPEPLDPRPAVPLKNLPAPDACFTDESQFSYQLSLFSEELEKKQIWYDNQDPELFANNSGIFHRVADHVKKQCSQYDYPPASLRGSVNLADWYARRGTLTVVKSREDAMERRRLIRPGSVMFFGRSGQHYNALSMERLLATGADRVIDHIGVVTEVKRDADGQVTGYVMVHGRGDGKTAQRTHYHALEPAGFGMPPLGNYSQQWVAVADLRTERSEIHTHVAGNDPVEETTIPANPSEQDVFTIPNTPGAGAMACFGFDFDDYFFRDVALALEAEKIPYKSGPYSDCSGIVYRVCNKVSDKLGAGCAGNFRMPCEDGYRDSRKLARWYHDNGNLQVVTNPKKMGDLIQVGSVMFYGQVGASYSKQVSIGELEKSGTGIQHVAVVVDVEKDDKGNVISYHLFHGHGRTGTPADITKPSKSRNQYARSDRKAFSYWDQQWVAIAPSILTLDKDNGLTQN